MKALSMKQPVPELILEGKKTIELRNWNTKFRGEFYLHASNNYIQRLLDKFEFEKERLTKGAIVGKAELIDVIKFETLDQFNDMKEKHLANATDWFKPGKTHGFILENPVRLEKPVKIKGRLNFFEVEL